MKALYVFACRMTRAGRQAPMVLLTHNFILLGCHAPLSSALQTVKVARWVS